VIGYETLYPPDRYGFVKKTPVANRFTGMGANPSTNPGERIFFTNLLVCIEESLLAAEIHHGFDIFPCRATLVAGSDLVHKVGSDISPSPGSISFRRLGRNREN
jgi:hypothetical protein